MTYRPASAARTSTDRQFGADGILSTHSVSGCGSRVAPAPLPSQAAIVATIRGGDQNAIGKDSIRWLRFGWKMIAWGMEDVCDEVWMAQLRSGRRMDAKPDDLAVIAPVFDAPTYCTCCDANGPHLINHHNSNGCMFPGCHCRVSGPTKGSH